MKDVCRQPQNTPFVDSHRIRHLWTATEYDICGQPQNTTFVDSHSIRHDDLCNKYLKQKTGAEGKCPVPLLR